MTAFWKQELRCGCVRTMRQKDGEIALISRDWTRCDRSCRQVSS
jgi:hypothetical protein